MVERRSVPVSMTEVLRSKVGRRFFDDEVPRARQVNAKPWKTAEVAWHESDLLVLALRRNGRGAALDLALRLESCLPRCPCLSAACPACGRALQRIFVHACRNLFEHHARDMEAINIVSARRAIPYGRLDRYDLFEGINRRLRRALSTVGVPAVGGFDVSANEHEANAFRPHWMPHAWILAPGRRIRRVEEELREWFPATDIVPRPMLMRSFDGAPGGFAYALKPDFERRVSLVPRTLPNGSRSTFSTRKKPIWAARRVELAIALDRAGLDARLFLKGYQVIQLRGEVEIVGSRPHARSMRPGRRRPAKGGRDDDPS
jgi:hypothetical protein